MGINQILKRYSHIGFYVLQPLLLNGEVCTVTTDEQTHTQIQKVNTEETYFYIPFFYLLNLFL